MVVECSCGFSCGTAAAYLKHVGRFDGSAASEHRQLTQAERKAKAQRKVRVEDVDISTVGAEASGIYIGPLRGFLARMHRDRSNGDLPVLLPLAGDERKSTKGSERVAWCQQDQAIVKSPRAVSVGVLYSRPNSPAALQLQTGLQVPDWSQLQLGKAQLDATTYSSSPMATTLPATISRPVTPARIASLSHVAQLGRPNSVAGTRPLVHHAPPTRDHSCTPSRANRPSWPSPSPTWSAAPAQTSNQVRILVVRHARSENKDKGQNETKAEDPDLALIGYKQADALCRRLVWDLSECHLARAAGHLAERSATRGVMVVSSPMRRCLLTIDSLVTTLGLGPDSAICHGASYEYRACGADHRGSTLAEMQREFPAFRNVEFAPDGFWQYSGTTQRETEPEVRQRALKFADWIRNEAIPSLCAQPAGPGGHTLVLVTHQTFSDLLCQLLIEGNDKSWEYGAIEHRMQDGGMTELLLEGGRWRLGKSNQTEHLAGIQPVGALSRASSGTRCLVDAQGRELRLSRVSRTGSSPHRRAASDLRRMNFRGTHLKALDNVGLTVSRSHPMLNV